MSVRAQNVAQTLAKYPDIRYDFHLTVCFREGTPPVALNSVPQHQQLARRAVHLETAGDYTAAADLWHRISEQAPERQWREFAGHRAALCRTRKPVTIRDYNTPSSRGNRRPSGPRTRGKAH